MRRSFLFLQGPHGPFFAQLAKELVYAGHGVLRVGFNRGDEVFWGKDGPYLAFRGEPHERRSFLDQAVRDYGVTDVVLYSDTRPAHRDAVEIANDLGLVVHCFEEGYLRPYWITYERGGANGNSPLMDRTMADIEMLVGKDEPDLPDAPAHWGNLWGHNLWSSLYHLNVWFRNHTYPHYRSHRGIGLRDEFVLQAYRWLVTGPRAGVRWWLTRRLVRTRHPYHVVLLQLGHDANMRDHADFASVGDFVRLVIKEFAAGAPAHHQLVFKAHPLEDGREPVERHVQSLAKAGGLKGRVWFLPGGRLGPLLDRATTAITINSTAAQQALWRGLPVKAFGQAVFAKPEFVSDQPLRSFFADGTRPDLRLYRMFRHYLLRSSQILGSFYSSGGRREAIRRLVDLMLDDHDAYDRLHSENATSVANLRLATVDGLTCADGSESNVSERR